MSVIKYLAEQDGVDLNFILSVARRARHSYKRYTIPKATGGNRVIHHPGKHLKLVQRWITKRFINHFPVHQHATAYKRGSSIKHNVTLHKNNRFLLRMDFTDFFESLTINDFKIKFPIGTTYKKAQIDLEDLRLFENILFLNGKMTIGAPSSPALSNVLMFEFDKQATKMCEEASVAYTRYADDMFFSSNQPNILSDIEIEIYKIVDLIKVPANLKIKAEKTRHSSKKGRRNVTGLILTSNNTISIGRFRKKEIKARIHKCLVGRPTPEEINHVLGLLAFSKDAEPDFINRLKHKYGSDFIDKIKQMN